MPRRMSGVVSSRHDTGTGSTASAPTASVNPMPSRPPRPTKSDAGRTLNARKAKHAAAKPDEHAGQPVLVREGGDPEQAGAGGQPGPGGQPVGVAEAVDRLHHHEDEQERADHVERLDPVGPRRAPASTATSAATAAAAEGQAVGVLGALDRAPRRRRAASAPSATRRSGRRARARRRARSPARARSGARAAAGPAAAACSPCSCRARTRRARARRSRRRCPRTTNGWPPSGNRRGRQHQVMRRWEGLERDARPRLAVRTRAERRCHGSRSEVGARPDGRGRAAPPRGDVVVVHGELLEELQALRESRRTERRRARCCAGGPRARRPGLRRTDQGLGQLLARPQSGDLDLDVVVRSEPAQSDHALGERVDVDLLAHLERQHLVVTGERCAEQHEPNGLVGAHEVPGHPRIGDRHRAAGGDLLLERGDHAAATPEHVAEPHRAVAVVQLARSSTICSASHFDAPMTLVGVGRLVGGDAHELRHVDRVHRRRSR